MKLLHKLWRWFTLADAPTQNSQSTRLPVKTLDVLCGFCGLNFAAVRVTTHVYDDQTNVHIQYDRYMCRSCVDEVKYLPFHGR